MFRQPLKLIGGLFVIASSLTLSAQAFPVAKAPSAIQVRTGSVDAHVVWNKAPIQFSVPVGHQRMISFPDRVQVINANPQLTTEKVTILNNNGTLYITAHKPFKPTLLQVKLLKSSAVVMVYLSGKSRQGDTTPLDVVVPAVSPSAYKPSSTPLRPTVTVNAVSLLRFAMQQFSYERIASHPNNITRTPMFTTRTVSIYAANTVRGFPLISWRAGDLFVTAVQLKNMTAYPVTLTPLRLKGHWQAASFYRFDAMRTLVKPEIPFNQLTARGTKRDYTLLFVVSSRPFGQSLQALVPFVRQVGVSQ